MMDRAPFVPGLVLGRTFFEEAGRAIVESVAPRDSYAAALIGKGSDVLGFDTPTSVDHDWGPRFQFFLPEPGFESRSAALDDALRARLPTIFRGFDVAFSDADSGPVAHHVEITTLQAWLRRYLGIEGVSGLRDLDWLLFPEQRLLEVTSGEIFHDPRGDLRRVREALREFPRDVWLYRMACQWQRLSQAESFVGRCAEVGDALGMTIVSARIVKDAMKLCFLIERRYSPYDKWLGTAFARLACAAGLQPLLSAVLHARSYEEMEPSLLEIYRKLGAMHNALGVTGPMDSSPRQFFSRQYTVMRSDRFANALLRAVGSEALRRIPVRMGGIDQLIDNTDFIESPSEYRKALGLYRPPEE
jgi:hypothetical protein